MAKLARMARTISDDQALARLAAASEALGEEPGATVRGNTALTTARAAMSMLILGLEQAIEEDADEVSGVAPQA